nr:hypothetical protein [Candidatus Sigynarchaeum springense]
VFNTIVAFLRAQPGQKAGRVQIANAVRAAMPWIPDEDASIIIQDAINVGELEQDPRSGLVNFPYEGRLLHRLDDRDFLGVIKWLFNNTGLEILPDRVVESPESTFDEFYRCMFDLPAEFSHDRVIEIQRGSGDAALVRLGDIDKGEYEAAIKRLVKAGDLVEIDIENYARINVMYVLKTTMDEHASKPRCTPEELAEHYPGIPVAEAEALDEIGRAVMNSPGRSGEHPPRIPYRFGEPFTTWDEAHEENCHYHVDGGHVVALWVTGRWMERWDDRNTSRNDPHLPLAELPASIGNLVHLRKLFLAGNNLATLPGSFGNLVHLEELDLTYNELTSLPESFGNLCSLRTLHVDVKALPESFGNLASLENLVLHGVARLAESFGNLRALKNLRIGFDGPSPRLPESFGNLASLERLDLSYNRLASLPDSFGNLRKLTTLLLKGNPLENLPQSCKFLDVLEETDAREMFLPLQSPGIEQHVSKELLRRLPHPGRVNTVAFSPNGDILASGSQDYTTRLWEARSGNLLGMLKGHEAQVSSIAFSPDGSKVVTCSYDSSVRIWAVPTGEPQHVLRVDASSEPFTSVAFSPDGSMVAAGSWDKCIHIWDPLDGKPLRVLEGHSKWVTQVSFSPDGTFLASISSDGTTRCWNPQDGTELHVVKGFNRAADAIAVSPNGEDVAISVSNIIHVIDVATGTTRFFLDSKFPASIFSLAYSPDGHLLAAGSSDKTVRIWDVSKREIVQTITDWFSTCMYGVAFSPDGTQVASGSESSGVCIWTVSY